MAFEPDQNERRAEVKQLFRQLQRIRAAKAERAEPERVVELCRQAAESLEPKLADLQRGTIKAPAKTFHKGHAQKAARRAAAPQQHVDLDQAPKPDQGRGLSHGMGL